MNPQKNNNAAGQIRRVTIIGLTINVLLSILKVTTGVLFSSMALIADGLHSLSDMVTDFAVIIGAKFGAKEPDINHPYGHGWAETFSAVFVAAILAAVGGLMVYRSLRSIGDECVSNIGIPVFLIAIFSVIAKEFSYQITKKVALKLSSTMLYANAWHHRSDAVSSIAVAIGAIASLFGFKYADQIAAIVVGVMIVIVAIKILGDCLGQLTERSAGEATEKQIADIIASQPDIRTWHKLRTRTVGRELFMDLHIMVASDLSITQAHHISDLLEKAIHSQFVRPVNITVHIEPDIGQ
ncbi:MAG: cation diffusion facilitator family transporter [Anaerohalosphaeraceae bacterium]|nr:cation diffusion facilitator family transporter [Anaerohalosphaeraceae bacterium]